MSDSLYREIILEHWQNPQNYGVINNADIDIADSNPLCGDEVRITIKLNKSIIEQIAFTAEGCTISTASSSLLTTMATGMPVEEFLKITPEAYLEQHDFCLSPARIKCALLGFSTLQKALKK